MGLDKRQSDVVVAPRFAKPVQPVAAGQGKPLANSTTQGTSSPTSFRFTGFGSIHALGNPYQAPGNEDEDEGEL